MPSSKQIEIGRKKELDQDGYSDPLAAELRRCQLLGDAALNDQDCATTWTETRRRFLNPSPSSDQEE
jgi:conjugative transfer region protein TrbK